MIPSIILILGLTLAALSTSGSSRQMATVRLEMTAPCTNADVPPDSTDPWDYYDPCELGSPLENLAAIDIWGQRCGQTDSTLFKSVVAYGKECQTINDSIEVETGHTYWLWARSRKISGVVSICRGPQLSIAVPLVEP